MENIILVASDLCNTLLDGDKFFVKIVKNDDKITVTDISIPDACFYTLGKIGVINMINDLIVASCLV